MAVVPDGGGEGEQALGDSRGDPGEGAPAVQLEVELAFEGVVHRLDELADRGQQRLAGARGPVAVGRAQQVGDRKSTRLNSSHANISYAVFCLKKKNYRSNPIR